MNEAASNKPATWFWIVSVLALAWNAWGAMSYLGAVTMSEAQLAEFPADEAALMTSMPVWATAAFALAVWTGVIGCVGLLLRKAWAKTVFMVSFAGVIIQFTWWIGMSGALDVYGASAIGMPVAVTLVAGGLIWFAGDCTKRGWLS